MKLSHLSLAIFSAIALAACGGSSNSDHTTPEQDQNQDQNQNQGGQEEETTPEQKEEVAKEDAAIVDPTRDRVVDNIILAETSTTASQQYVRGNTSIHDRVNNPTNATPASATALSGITLDVQNPYLTNIVIGRIESTNSKGEPVKIAQFAGSRDSNLTTMGNTSGEETLQDINLPNVRVDGLYIENVNASGAGWNNKTGFVAGAAETLARNPIFPDIDANDAQDIIAAAGALEAQYDWYMGKLAAYNAEVDAGGPVDATTIKELKDATSDLNTAVNEYNTAYANANDFKDNASLKLGQNAVEIAVLDTDGLSKVDSGNAVDTEVKGGNTDVKSVIIELGPNTKYLSKYGYGAYFFAIDGTPNIQGNLGWGDEITPAGVVGHVADTTTDAGAPTHGLVGVYNVGNNVIVRGAEDNNVRTSRIFGHYYLDPSVDQDNKLFGETSNSWERPVTFITGFDQNNKPSQYGFGAEPMVLRHVQYGRVTAVIDDYPLANMAGTNGWRKEHQEKDDRDPQKLGDADDFYFYRGTNATSIEQMAALPKDAKINYKGHALMYGIDNKFHGAGLELPNAFGNTNSYGLGNFVEATLDMGAKKFEGTVFNSWHNKDQKVGQNDTLVTFSGNVTGNTVVGQATRNYVENDRPADLRASFYGANASEVGGSFNSVTRQDPFGPISWGGVFGAKRTASGGNAWLVSSEDK